MKSFEVAAALIILEGGGVTVLDGGVSLDTVGFTDWFALGGAINLEKNFGFFENLQNLMNGFCNFKIICFILK